ncbi:MAG TPA: hypothetical protein VH012_08840 [Acidimicrobiales bacterium]|jgi:hypothetical protein|nr:hypothetical protein [Acidimicrobiales bacterium]
MGIERRALQQALADLEQTMNQTQHVLGEAGSTYGTLRARIAEKVPVADAFSDMAMPWSEVARQLEELETVRRRVRKAVFALGLSEGMTIGDLGRLYGFSRQLAARIARELREEEAG